MQGMRDVTENIAHDMRKPISRLRSRIEGTLMGPRDPDAYREALNRTNEEADQLLALFNELLTIALAESRASDEGFERIDLTEIVRSAVEIYEPAAEEAGFRLVVRVDPSVPFTGNPHLLTQAVANLIDNAIKHVPDGGEVTIEAASGPREVRLAVADRGTGIPESFRQKALERFSRLDKSRTTPGSGLGLSLVRAVASLHGGTISLEDNRPGLKVVLRLPVPTPNSNRSSHS
jgi:signal transduction histidine kinase